MFLPRIAVNQATVNIAVVTTTTIIKATDAIAMIADLTIVIKTIDATIDLNVTTRTGWLQALLLQEKEQRDHA